MKVKLPSGVILESNDHTTYEQWLKYGGIEANTTVEKPNKRTNKKDKLDETEED